MPRLFETRSERRRRRYFTERGFNEPPYEPEERFHLAQQFFEQGDYETALILYSKVEDFDYSEFTHLIGQIYSDEKSEFYDLRQGAKLLRQAFRHAQTEDVKLNIANSLISTQAARRGYGPSEIRDLLRNPYNIDALTSLVDANRKIDFFQIEPDINIALYQLASAYSSGAIGNIDHQKANDLYIEYIQREHTGYIAKAYENMAIRTALGLGCEADPEKAIRILETAIIVLDGSATINPSLHKTLKNYADKQSEQNYKRVTSNLRPAIADGAHPLTMSPFIMEAAEHDTDAISDVSFLGAYLAHSESWGELEYWRNIANASARKSSYVHQVNFDFSMAEPSNAYSAFRPEYAGLEERSLQLSARQIEQYNYFKRHNLGFPPIDQESRLNLAITFRNKVPPNYEAALMLFDEDFDNEHSVWLLEAGFIYDQHIDNPFFNPEKAVLYYKRSSVLGNPKASSNLGLKYRNGNEVEIDLDEALKWYELSANRGNARAYGLMADVKLLQMSLDNPGIEVSPDEEIANLYLEGAKKGCLEAWNQYALCQLNGTGITKSEKNALDNWLKILKQTPQTHEEGLHASLSYKVAVRLCFGLGVDRNINNAISLLDSIPVETNNGFIKNQVQEWKKSLTDEIDACFSEDELRMIQNIYKGSIDIGSLINAIENRKVEYSEPLRRYIAIVQHLAELENWSNQHDWSDLSEAIHARQLGFSFRQAAASTRDSGPRYNPLDNRGLPILGVLQRPSIGNDDEEEQRQDTGSYIPQPGMQSVKGILAHEDGFKYTGDYSEDFPAIITEEDRHIAEILVFGDPDNGPIYPSLSLEKENNDEYGKGAKGSGYNKPFTYKIFDPQWLAYTDFGRTLWITDYLIGQWCWRPEKFRIGTANDNFPEEKFLITQQYETAAEFIRDIRLTGGRSADGASRRIMIQPSTRFIVPDSPTGSDNQKQASVRIKQMTMKVYGSYITNASGKENRRLFEEDPNFAQGRTVRKLTDRYNVISQLDPRFTRAQQLMALLYGHLRLHDIGYRPSPHLQEELTFKLRAMQSLGRDKDERLVVRHNFGHRPNLQGI